MSTNFNHIPDMDHDGKITVKDIGCFHDMNHTYHDSDYTKSLWDICFEYVMYCFLVLAAPLVVLRVGAWLGQLLG